MTKCIAEGSLQAYLIAIYLIQAILATSSSKKGFIQLHIVDSYLSIFNNLSIFSPEPNDNQPLTIPIGNILAAVFDNRFVCLI